MIEKPGLADIICLTAWLIVPIALAVWWIRMKIGIDKRWFVMPSAPLISRNIYFFLPAFIVGSAIFFVDLLLNAHDPYSSPIPAYIALGLYGLGFVLSYLEPDWLSPTWYRWLKNEHGDILPLLAQEAQRLGRQEWLERVKTHEDLKQWVEDFRGSL
jgi:hypothetical protein